MSSSAEPRGTGSAALALVLLGLVATCVIAVLTDTPRAVWVLAGALVAVAVLRCRSRWGAVLAARSLAFDVVVLLTGAAVLAVLAPAGFLN